MARTIESVTLGEIDRHQAPSTDGAGGNLARSATVAEAYRRLGSNVATLSRSRIWRKGWGLRRGENPKPAAAGQSYRRRRRRSRPCSSVCFRDQIEAATSSTGGRSGTGTDRLAPLQRAVRFHTLKRRPKLSSRLRLWNSRPAPSLSLFSGCTALHCCFAAMQVSAGIIVRSDFASRRLGSGSNPFSILTPSALSLHADFALSAHLAPTETRPRSLMVSSPVISITSEVGAEIEEEAKR